MMVGHCEFDAGHPDIATQSDQPEADVLVSTSVLPDGGDIPRRPNIKLCADCADEFGVADHA